MSRLVRAMRPPKDARARQRKRAADLSAALSELRQFNDRELADIGLGRSCLTPEGLACAASKRARQLERG